MTKDDIYGTVWDKSSVRLVVDSYFQCRALDLQRKSFVKSHVYRDLAGQIGRTEKSVELKFQNVSAILDELGMEWITGLAPRWNYQNLLFEVIGEKLDTITRCDAYSPQVGYSQGLNEAQAIFQHPDSLLDYEAPPEKNQRPDKLPEQMQFLARKFDPVLRDLRNRALGEAGERTIFENEKSLLHRSGRPDLANKVEWISRDQGDGAGFDILSFDIEGKEKFLEVKTTTGWRNTPFYMSNNEVEFARRTNNRYSIIRVYDFRRSAKAFQIENPIEQCVHLRADGYNATFG
jgi:hypothetical protein